MPRISVVILTYRVKSFLEHCLASVYQALHGTDHEIFVVDNNSNDGTEELFTQTRPHQTYIRNTTNAGFACGNNQALAQCTGEYVFLLNPDTVVQHDTFTAMADFMDAHPDTGMAGCKVLNPDGSLQQGCRRSFPTPWASFFKLSGLHRLFPKSRRMNAYNLSYLDPDEEAEVDAISGSFMCIRRTTLEQVGMLDEAFFMYGEDLDWCYRIRQAGWKIFYVPITRIIHFKGESSRGKGFRNIMPFYKSMHIFVRKHYRGRSFFLSDWLLTAGIVLWGVLEYGARFSRRFRGVVLQIVLMNIALLAGLLLRFKGLVVLSPYNDERTYALIFGMASVVWLIGFGTIRLATAIRMYLLRSLAGVTLGCLVLTSFTFFFKDYAYSRLVALYTWGIGALLIALWRGITFAVRNLTGKARKRRILIVGTRATSERLLRLLQEKHPQNYHVIGFIDDDEHNLTTAIEGIRVIGTTAQVPRLVGEFDIDDVLVAPLSIPYEKVVFLMSQLQNGLAHVRLVSEGYETIIDKTSIDSLEMD